jgi:hypothetical protein
MGVVGCVSLSERIRRPASISVHPPSLPILVVTGPNRAGKTTFAKALSETLDYAHSVEPRVLLRTGHSARQDDSATAEDARPWVREHLRNRLSSLAEGDRKRGVIIDSPEAFLKLSFLAVCLPQAKCVLLVSDDLMEFQRLRAITDSQLSRLAFYHREFRRRVASQVVDMHWRDVPAYLVRLARDWTAVRVCKAPRVHGVRYPGWQHDARTLEYPEIVKKQHRLAVQVPQEQLAALEMDWCLVTRASLLRAPAAAVRPVLSMLGVQSPEQFADNFAARFEREIAGVSEQDECLDPTSSPRPTGMQ